MAFRLFARGVRAFGAASLLGTVGVPVVVLLVATPVALLVRTLHGSLSWLTRFPGMTGPFVEASIAVASSLGGILLFVLFTRLLLRFYRRRGTNLYGRLSTVGPRP